MTDPQPIRRADVFVCPLALDDFATLCRAIERDHDFPNVDDYPDSIDWDAHDNATRQDNGPARRRVAMEKSMLIVGEVAEFAELVRDDRLSGVHAREELADIIIRVLALAAALGFDRPLPPILDVAHDDDRSTLKRLDITVDDLGNGVGTLTDIMRRKAAYNADRPPKHGKAL